MGALLDIESFGYLGALIGVVRMRGACALFSKVTVMSVKELKCALGMISRVLADPRCKPGYGDQLRRAKRELKAVLRSGKLEQGRLFRAVEIVATVLKDIVEDNAGQRPE
jgi:hypothetical protein